MGEKKEKTLKTLVIVCADFPSASVVWQGEDAGCVGVVLVLGCLTVFPPNTSLQKNLAQLVRT